MSLDLSFYGRGEMSRRPIVVRTTTAIERRAGSNLNMLVAILFGTFAAWLAVVLVFAL